MNTKYTIDGKKARNNLLEAMHLIRCDGAFAQISDTQYPGLQPNQQGGLASAHSRLKREPESVWQCNIPQIEIPIIDNGLEAYNPAVLIGGIIESERGVVTHSSFSLCVTFSSSPAKQPGGLPLNPGSCCLTSYSGQKRIVRRFHFDHQPNETNKPSDHLQFGGRFPGFNGGQTAPHYCLEAVDNPRLHYLPMDFVLLFDLAIRDFKTPLTSLVGGKSWRKLVVNSQNIWWSDYLAWLGSTVNSKPDRIIHEIIYS